LRDYLALSLGLLLGTDIQMVQAQSRFDELANLPFSENRPTAETAKTLSDDLLFQCATQTYLWALPLINTLGMKYGSEKVFGAGYNVSPIWKERLDAKTLVTTPNSDVIYAMSYVDLGKDGPLVFEAPPMLQGILLDFWQRPIPVDGGKFFGDVGLPGPDGGKGGKFLLLPPDYKGEVPEGYFVYRSATNNVFIAVRGSMKPLVIRRECRGAFLALARRISKLRRTKTASGSQATRIICCTCRRMCRSSSSGP
jgi:hypothetical protein